MKIRLLKEYIDDEDELSPAERALIAKAEKELKQRGIKVKDFDPDKIVGVKDEDDDGEDEDKQTLKNKVEPSKTKPVETKKQKPIEKGSQPQQTQDEKIAPEAKSKKLHIARKFMQDNPTASRKEFMQFMAQHGMSPAYANIAYYKVKSGVKEVFYITNDQGQVLAEGDVWTVFEDDAKRLQVFKYEWNAKKKALKTGGEVKVFSD